MSVDLPRTLGYNLRNQTTNLADTTIGYLGAGQDQPSPKAQRRCKQTSWASGAAHSPAAPATT